MCAAALSTAFLATSCGSKAQYSWVPNPTPERREIEEAAAAVDVLKWYVDTYGTAGISSPLLVQPDDSFKFNLTTTADQFFATEREQISGRSAGYAATADVGGASLSAAADLTALQQYAVALAAFHRDQSRESYKRALLDQSARQQYAAALAAARTIKDPQERAAAEAAAAKQLADSLTGPAADTALTPPAAPPPPSLPSFTPVASSAAGLLPQLAAPQSLYSSSTPGVSGETRAALLMAAGDVATSAMLGLLLDPSKVTKFSGKRVLFGVSMIAVNPGWKTKSGYGVDLQASLKYEWVQARPAVRDGFLARKSDVPVEQEALSQLQRCVVRSLQDSPDASSNGSECIEVESKRCSTAPTLFRAVVYQPYVYNEDAREHPVVAAASPMGDGQALDLQASSRQARQSAYQMALSLSAAGLGAQASAFKEFAKSLEGDIETRTNNVVVSAYSSTSGVFGFKINPRLAASPRDGGQAHVLQVPTFPMLLVIGAEDNELHARVKVVGERCFVVEPRLAMFTGSRWTRIDEPCRSDQPPQSCLGRELTETERTRVAAAALRKLTQLWDACELLGAQGAFDEQFNCNVRMSYLDRQREVLTEALASDSQKLWIPAELLNPSQAKVAKPSITVGAPSSVQLVYDEAGHLKPLEVTMVIVGKDLDQVDTSKIKSPTGPVTAKLVEGTLQLTFTVAQPGVYSFGLPLKGSTSSLVTPALQAKAADAPHSIHRQTTKEKNGVKDTLTISPATPVDVVKSEIEKNKLPADLKIDVEAGTRTTTTKATK